MAFDDETRRVAADAGARVLSVSLVVLDGPSRGLRVKVQGTRATIGSSAACSLVLADRSVSRVHCALEIGAAGIALKDLGSTNGTRVGEVTVRDADLLPGAVVQLGASAFRVEVEGQGEIVPLSPRDAFGELVGESVAMRQLYSVLERVAPTDATLLLTGETGTGKDVAARSVHAASPRRGGPFVPVDCGAIPESLIESELFGHVRGAFTGAIHNRKGAFEEAHGGTLFLDEIGEMPVAMQAKLLRALESRSIRRVGATGLVPVDVRVIAATHRTLARSVNEGTFREDLYYRLAVVELTLPPLRARQGDVPLLARRFFERIAPPYTRLSPDALRALEARSWPGNVRELRNYVERAVALGQVQDASVESGSAPRGSPAAPAPLPEGLEVLVPLSLPLKEARERWVEAFESVYVRAMLRETEGNVTRAAERAGVSRRFLQRTLARLGLSRDDDDG
ncbi:MAG: sigma 54-dependent Fis family transcriptional regulator [Myxococcales bacterium]|nr:sigma 54-dependent Fis family transcriptional regulator [Myxococcales bacterium]